MAIRQRGERLFEDTGDLGAVAATSPIVHNRDTIVGFGATLIRGAVVLDVGAA
jgi:hypothetical protein